MKPILFVLISLVAGFVGGILGVRVAQTGERSVATQVVRARKFELVDETGRAISYWGIDQDNYAVLAFGWYERGTHEGGTDAPRSAPGGIENPRNQHARFGVAGISPFVDFRGSDGETRLSMSLAPFSEPVLYMKDEIGPRLRLGVLVNDTLTPSHNWGLTFEPDRAVIGMFTRDEGEKKYVSGLLDVDKDDIILPPTLPRLGPLTRPPKKAPLSPSPK